MQNIKTSISALFDVALHLPHNFEKDGMSIIPKYEADITLGELGQESINISEVESFNYTKDYVMLKMYGGTEVSLTEEDDGKIFVHKEVMGEVSCKKLAYIKNSRIVGQIKLAYRDVSAMKLDINLLIADTVQEKRDILIKLLEKGTDNFTKSLILNEKIKGIEIENLREVLFHEVYQLSDDGTRIEITN